MQKQLELVKFTLTPKMSLELIKFNKLKKELLNLKSEYNLGKNECLLLKIKQKEVELNKSRNTFIREFRINNKEEITKYLDIKNQL